MHGIIDRILIFSCCFTLLVSYSTDTTTVLALLTAITINALNGLYKSSTLLYISTLLYVATSFIWISFAFFLPLVFYDGMIFSEERQRNIWVIAPISILFLVSIKLPPNARSLVILLLIVSWILGRRTFGLLLAQSETKKLRDDDWEMAMLLQEKNRGLMEKQDYGVHMAKLNERSRIAREIHDHVGHLLSRSILQIGALLVQEEKEETKVGLAAVRDTLSQAMDRIRLSVHGLYEESSDLKTQVATLVKDFSFCPIRLDYKLEETPSKDMENCFIAVIKEGLSNITRHSNATQVTLILLEHPALFQLILQDNGTKFEETPKKGLGLRSMADRVEALGGRLTIEHSGGFRLFISIPKGGVLHEHTTS